MCGARRAAHAQGFGYSLAQAPLGHQPHSCHRQRGCGGRRSGYGHHQHEHHENTSPFGAGVGRGPISAAVDAVIAIANAVESRSNAQEGQTAQPVSSSTRGLGGQQVTGVTRRNEKEQHPPVYHNDGKVPITNEKEVEPDLDGVEEPPPYTPPDNAQAGAAPSAHAQPPISTQIYDVNANFAALPILQSHPRTPAIERDVADLSNAIASAKLGECGGRCATKRAKKQLVRDLWETERTKFRAMNRADKKMVKARFKAVKRTLKAELKAEMRA